jgi:hypothetical protein
MLRPSSRRAAVALSAGATVLAVGAAALPAQATAVPGWRINTTFPVTGRESILTSVAAVSARDAWSAGVILNDKSGAFGSLIRHWTGRSWTPVTLPAKVAGAWSRLLPVSQIAGASSTSDVWIFGGLTSAAYLRLNGRRWSLGHLPGTVPAAQKFVQVNAARVFSKSNVWAFGETDNESSQQLTVTPYAAHFNGARWTVTHVPGNSPIVAVSAASASSVWAVAGTSAQAAADGQGGSAGQQAVLHWTPKGGWQQLPQPALPKGAQLSAVTLHAGQVVVGGSLPNGRKGRSALLITWNGKVWSAPRVAGASPTKWTVAGVASDGRGGTWVLGFHESGSPGKLWHVVAGKWAAVLPAFGKHAWLLEQITPVPHTDSVWGAGALKVGKSTVGLLALAGPTPR